MITVFAIPLAFISPSSVSGAASLAETLAPCAKGKAGSCFQTWTWGSIRRVSAAMAMSGAPRRKVRRDRSNIDRLELRHDVFLASFVALPRAFTRDVEIGAQPTFEVDRLQHAMATGKIDRAIAEVKNILG